ncbi:MAG: RNA methyltransferase [bacterium]|nr:MAG: RNA methyltransferase [bacterium]
MISKSGLKNILALKHKKFRTEQELLLIEGFHLCLEALQSDFTVATLLINPDNLPPQKVNEIIQIARNKQVEIIEIQQYEVNQLADTVNSQGIFCIVQQKKYNLTAILNKDNKFIILINEGQDPGNVGTIIRTCDWFGIDAVLLSNGTVELFNPKVIRSTMGSIFHLPIIEGVDLNMLLPRFKQHHYHIFGTDVNGEYPYHQINYPVPLVLVVGNENQGIDKKLWRYFDKIVKIPSYGKAESLNMALAAAIIISRVVN